MFIASIQQPCIGQHKWLVFDRGTFVINADNKKDAVEIIRKSLPKKDPEVQKKLCGQKGYEPDEYFEIRLHEVPEKKRIAYIHEPSCGFNKPHEVFRM